MDTFPTVEEANVAAQHLHDALDEKYSAQVGMAREAVLHDMSPGEIAEMVAIHFDESPEDVLDTAEALVGQFGSMGYRLNRDQAHEWADKAFGV